MHVRNQTAQGSWILAVGQAICREREPLFVSTGPNDGFSNQVPDRSMFSLHTNPGLV